MVDVKTHLMFQGEAEEAIELYKAVFDEFDVTNVERYGEEDELPPGSFKLARVSFAGYALLILDSPPIHKFSFTPAFSLFVDFDSEAALEAAFAKLSEGGAILMPLDDYGFSTRFTWIEDRFGVSWQLNLPHSSKD